nr:MAG TPA: hypothetical protein [Caudoviricetes sp.]
MRRCVIRLTAVNRTAHKNKSVSLRLSAFVIKRNPRLIQTGT